ncbi:MAG: molybdopterin-dependent oxidoreductase, partial [Spirochaetota bacterium]
MDEFNRRDFLKITGGTAAGIGVGAVASASPFRALQWLVEWSQDQYVPAPGSEKYIAAQCGFCPSRCALSLRTAGKRAVKAENGNKGCALSQLVIQSLYHPDRIKTPLKRSGARGSGSFSPVSWESALAEIAESAHSLVSDGKTKHIASISPRCRTAETFLLESMLSAAGTPHIYREPSQEELSARAAAAVT